MTPKEALELAKEYRVVDFRYCDLRGAWHHFSIPAVLLDEAAFRDGVALDAGLLRPDPEFVFADPFAEQPTLALVGERDHAHDPRALARRALAHLDSCGLGAIRLSSAFDCFFFDDVRHEVREHAAFHQIDSVEGAWNAGRGGEPNLGGQIHGAGAPVAPFDQCQDVRAEAMLAMGDAGIAVERHVHGAGPGQARFALGESAPLRHADHLMLSRHVVRNVARQNGLAATFMPCPLRGGPGSTHTLRIGLGPGVAPERVRRFAAGIERHRAALLALVAPSTNAYRHGGASPFQVDASSPDAVAVGLPDPGANPYLALSAVLMAGCDGVRRGLEPGGDAGRRVPRSLEEALDALEENHGFLREGDVYAQELIDTHLARKREWEVDPLRRCPHPYEFALYFGA